MRSIRYDQLTEAPWRNGGGITREVAREMRDGAVLWRLSIADVAAEGPFSDFAGLTRVLTVIEGGPMRLETPEGALLAERFAPVTFDGGLPVSASLPNGPLRDLNLMFDPARMAGTVSVLHGPCDRAVAARGTSVCVVFGLTGNFGLNALSFGAGDTVVLEGEAARLTLGEGESVLLIALDPL